MVGKLESLWPEKLVDIADKPVLDNLSYPTFLGPRGPLGLPSFVRPFVRSPVRPQEKSGSAV